MSMRRRSSATSPTSSYGARARRSPSGRWRSSPRASRRQGRGGCSRSKAWTSTSVRSRTAEQAQAVKQCIDGFYILPADAQVSCQHKARKRLNESLRRLEAQDDARLGVHLASPPSPFPTGMDRPHYYHHAGRLRQGDSEAVECYAQHA